MKKRISFLLTILILISAFMISASADYINTFQFLQNLSFIKQTNFNDSGSITYKPVLFSYQDSYSFRFTRKDANNQSVTFSYPAMVYGFPVIRGNIEGYNSNYIEINIPFNLFMQAGSSIKIPFLYTSRTEFSVTSKFSKSFINLGNDVIPMTAPSDWNGNFIGYINNVYSNFFTIRETNESLIGGYREWNRCQYFYFNLFNNTDKDVYVTSITLRINSGLNDTDTQILFPFIYEGDELVQYIPPNPYNIPILQDINSTLDLIISKLVSGDSSVADLLSNVLSLVESLDINIGSIDSNVIQIVNQLNYLSSLDASNSAISSTLIDIRRTLHDLAVGSQYLPTESFTQDINDNQQYINTEQATTVNRYNNANENKNDIYTSSSSGLNASGGTYDFVSNLVADAGSDQGFNGIFGLIFGNSNISGIILSVIALGTISYILYGKRG